MRGGIDPTVAWIAVIVLLVLASSVMAAVLARFLRRFELRAQLAGTPDADRCNSPHPHEAIRCTRLPHDPTVVRHHNHDRNRSWGLPHLPNRPGGTR